VALADCIATADIAAMTIAAMTIAAGPVPRKTFFGCILIHSQL
jgi:hypothetical protein